MIGGHAPFTLGDETLDALAAVVRGTGRGFHVHVSEDPFDAAHSHHAYGQDPLARLAAHGLLSDRALVAHGVHLPAADRGILEASGAFLAHNARSNMNNHVGYQHALPSLAQGRARHRRDRVGHARGVPGRVLQAPGRGRPALARRLRALPAGRKRRRAALLRRQVRLGGAGRRRRPRGARLPAADAARRGERGRAPRVRHAERRRGRR